MPASELQYLLRWCNHGLYDMRAHLQSTLQLPLGAPANALTFSGTPVWDGNHYNIASAASAYMTAANNIIDAQSEFFVVARVRFEGSNAAHPLERGRDGSGSGWSVQTIMDSGSARFYVVTTSGGAAARTADYSETYVPGQWYTYMGAYKSGSYVKVGVDGIWLDTETFTATGLRSSGQGLSVNRLNSASATGSFDMKLLGMGTAIPTDQDLLNIHQEILALERQPSIEGGVLLTSVGGGGGGGSTAAPANAIWF